MNETRKLAGVLVVGAAIGAVLDESITKDFEASARPVEVRFLPDGQTALAFTTQIGDCTSSRELVYGVDGGVRMNGHPTDEATATALRPLIEQARTLAKSVNPSIADEVRAVRFLGDGQTAMLLAKRLDGGVGLAELVTDADGGTPRLNGQPVPEDGTLRAASDKVREIRESAASLATDVLVRPLPKQAQAGGSPPAPVVLDAGPPGRL